MKTLFRILFPALTILIGVGPGPGVDADAGFLWENFSGANQVSILRKPHFLRH
jgi:hypothetical protein